ncbi:hypothetical protein PsorP6_010399 [Peronosclerospora sorghi]|uniref:Uncharacterized protein n=1 Tax=Peronosclerospora sorghi TaxID=230839 RepID=A0ACC0VWG1_9STRA|nr:hypothetical protein PsorP6_010399 [Peronosclerospora sorghi]
MAPPAAQKQQQPNQKPYADSSMEKCGTMDDRVDVPLQDELYLRRTGGKTLEAYVGEAGGRNVRILLRSKLQGI